MLIKFCKLIDKAWIKTSDTIYAEIQFLRENNVEYDKENKKKIEFLETENIPNGYWLISLIGLVVTVKTFPVLIVFFFVFMFANPNVADPVRKMHNL